MKLVKKIFLGTGLVFALGEISACSSITHSSYAKKAGLFPDRNVIYSQGQSMPPLKIPAGVSPIPNDPYYVIPNLSNDQANTVSLIPPGSPMAQKAGQKSS